MAGTPFFLQDRDPMTCAHAHPTRHFFFDEQLLAMEIRTDVGGYGKSLASAVLDATPALVCFDYFDTIVTRTVHPEDVKRIVCARVARIACPPLEGLDLYHIRARLEAEHCARNEAQQGDLEFRLGEVLSDLWMATKDHQLLDRIRFVELARCIELDVEKSVQVVDPEIASALESLVEHGVRCWVVSDFYFDSEGLGELLVHHGIEHLFESWITSSQVLATKRSGKLFDFVCTSAQLEPARILMIGDNPHSDVASPRSRGLMALGLDRASQHALYELLSRDKNDIEGTEKAIDSILEQSDAVFPEMALTLHAFVEALYARLRHAEATDVFFLAREGQFLKTIFDDYRDRRERGAMTPLRSHYIEVSRRSTFLPSLGNIETENFHRLFRQYRKLSLREFLLSLSLEDAAEELARHIGENLDLRHEDLPASDAFCALMACASFRSLYEARRMEASEALRGYIDGFNAADPAGTLHIVDVGWKGTIQDNLHAFLEKNPTSSGFTEISGHYVGLVASGSASARNRKCGLLFTSIPGESPNFHVFSENRALFEVVLGANHGSAHSYYLDRMGTPSVRRQEFVEESLYLTKIAPLQEHYSTLVSEIDALVWDRAIPSRTMRTFVTRKHARAVFSPTAEEISWFTGIYHVENFGVFERSTFGAPRAASGLLSQLRFYLALRRSKGGRGMDMGFWPWLTCLQSGGRWVAHRYATSKIRNMEI